ncbi:ATP phosphoribosyltransferase regulatory subunit [Exilibacterium tricleocarpae]|uniref:ATP phosphoribosyltransferase regulatory subunit n=1 Tax=Exilibacterium tricleocarpae TaxID=2591008 RepID=A0A545T5W7_9GAMM|nr:ATP phosphoribosyltransferase regulatory subunit [Exilibacterium tricleocarpae]TQV72630.1 ATP phosphoribosyltransferase regulatory subunit [Exilibacterium tricleocarpae]
MSYADRWLLPDGVEEILPAEAERIEQLRRRLLNLYHRWGYDLVIPPMVEFTESLLIGLGRDIDLLTFKVTDQLTGRSMGIRADITPQTARMDAHSLKRRGPNRLCYAGHVLHTLPRSPLATRTPIQVGVELYGEAGLDADIEVISLLLETLGVAELPHLHLELGHVGIYRALAEQAGLAAGQEETLFELLQRKATTEIAAWVNDNVSDGELAALFLALPALAGDSTVFERAQQLFAAGSAELQAALDELSGVADAVQRRYPGVDFYFDLSELRGYHYHTGLVFAAYAPGLGNAIATGGRYDHIGEVFGRGRPATGFAADLIALNRLRAPEAAERAGIYAEASDDAGQWRAIQQLRDSGERVVCGLSGQALQCDESKCDRHLVLEGGEYVVRPFADPDEAEPR